LEVGLNLDALTSALSHARYGERTSDAGSLTGEVGYPPTRSKESAIAADDSTLK